MVPRHFTSVCINPAIYLRWLVSAFFKNGAILQRNVLSHISEAASLHHTGKRADVIMNCTRLASKYLGGVEDTALYPVRDQVVMVRNYPYIMAVGSGTDDNSNEVCYVMNRAAGGGCVLGGCIQMDNWESQGDSNLAVHIMKRAIALVPSLVPPGKGALSVIRHGVRLRPMRNSGIRIEMETFGLGTVPVVHNYGHGGNGCQTSYGAARAAEKLVREILIPKARL